MKIRSKSLCVLLALLALTMRMDALIPAGALPTNASVTPQELIDEYIQQGIATGDPTGFGFTPQIVQVQGGNHGGTINFPSRYAIVINDADGFAYKADSLLSSRDSWTVPTLGELNNWLDNEWQVVHPLSYLKRSIAANAISKCFIAWLVNEAKLSWDTSTVSQGLFMSHPLFTANVTYLYEVSGGFQNCMAVYGLVPIAQLWGFLPQQAVAY